MSASSKGIFEVPASAERMANLLAFALGEVMTHASKGAPVDTDRLGTADEILDTYRQFQVQRQDNTRIVVALCERAGIEVGFQTDAHSADKRWYWRDDEGNAGFLHFNSEYDAAMDALKDKFGRDWAQEAGRGDTTRSLVDYVAAVLRDVEHEPSGMKP